MIGKLSHGELQSQTCQQSRPECAIEVHLVTLANRVTAALAVVMLLTVSIGAVLSFWQAVQRVEVETGAAMAHAKKSIEATLAGASGRAEDGALEHLIHSFDESRHLRAFLLSRGGVVEASRVNAGEEAPPQWFVGAIAPRAHSQLIELPAKFAPAVALRLVTEPTGEIGEIWEEVRLDFSLLAGLAVLGLLAARWTVSRALAPLSIVVQSIEAIGGGDYSPRVPLDGVAELQRIGHSCNVMAQKLAEMDRDNRRLNDELVTVQEEERAELARDLHDGVGPLMFAVDVDAMAIEERGLSAQDDEVVRRARSIRTSAGEMKAHVGTLLAKLRPEVALDLGLGHAVEQLVSACRVRHSAIHFETSVPANGWSKAVDGTIYYVIRESLNNALRHAGAKRIAISVGEEAGHLIAVRIRDDGRGVPAEQEAVAGYGVLGMSERVAALGGNFTLARNRDSCGTLAEALMPVPMQAGARPDNSMGTV